MRCEVVCEIGHNHQGDLATAMKMIVAAAEAGADAVKFQKRTNRDLYTKDFYEAPYNSENAFGQTYGEHRERLEFDKYQYRLLKLQAEDVGLKFYATAFDFDAVDFLMDVGVDGIKVASGDVTNTPLLSYAASMLKPMYVSTGACQLEDVERAVEAVALFQPHFTLFHCTAAYPCEFSELDLGVIATYRQMFPELTIGLSDHANAIWPATVAYALGARAIEKHFTLSRAMKGTDHAFSLEPQGLAKLVRDLRRCETALGAEKRFHSSEIPASVKMGKSLRAASDLSAGHVLHVDDISLKSPSCEGLPPYRLMDIVGKRLVRPLRCDEPITERDIDGRLRKAESQTLHLKGPAA